jgi:hypothetical protein
MADNVYEKTGAVLTNISHINNTYALLNTNLQYCQMGIATDLLKPFFRDHNGALHKIMTDASGATNIASGAVVFASVNGSATHDVDFLYSTSTGSLYIPYKVLHTGDIDTSIEFATDEIKINAGGIEAIDIKEASSIVTISLANSFLCLDQALMLKESTPPSPPSVGQYKIWADSTAHALRLIDSSAAVFEIALNPISGGAV